MANPLREWLEKERTITTVEELLSGLGAKMRELGFPVWRLSTSIWTSHPELMVMNLWWDLDSGITHFPISREMGLKAPRDLSPVVYLEGSDPQLRLRFDQRDDEVMKWKALRELKDRGVTDWAMTPLVYPGIQRATYLSMATKEKAGFTDAQVGAFNELRSVVELKMHACAREYATQALLAVYLGKNAAARVVAGEVLRGTGKEIIAAILFCDLRGFTELSAVCPVKELVQTLDGYFDAVATPVGQQGGEVLKFIGDAVLAIFDAEQLGAQAACERALAAAKLALASVKDLSAKAPRPLEVGFGLHFGPVMYGNVGAKDRLDFTVIGSAVNVASRVESSCKPLGVPLLLTEDLRRQLPAGSFRSLGTHPLKGVARPPELFTPAG